MPNNRKTPPVAQWWDIQWTQSSSFRTSAQLSFNKQPDTENGGKSPCCGGGLNSWSPDAMEIIQQRSTADWQLRQRDGRMGQLALRGQDGEGMCCTEERSNIKLLRIKTFWMQLWW